MGILKYHFMFTFRQFFVASIFLVTACICTTNAYADSITRREDQIKAVLLYNFTKFVEWPANRFVDETSPLLLCIIGQNPLGPILERTVENRKIRGRSIVVRRLQGLDSVKKCHLLFVSISEQGRVSEIVALLSGQSVLTVGAMDRFTEQNGIINLVKRKNRINFDINQTAAHQAGLKISSKLMILASHVTK